MKSKIEYVTHSPVGLKPFVIHNGLAYLHRYFQHETRIIEIKYTSLALGGGVLDFFDFL